MTTTTLPTVDFSRTGPVSAAEAAYADALCNVWIRHPSGGSVLVAMERSIGAAENLAASLNDVLGAWARLDTDRTAQVR